MTKERETAVVTFRLTPTEYEKLGAEPNHCARALVRDALAAGEQPTNAQILAVAEQILHEVRHGTAQDPQAALEGQVMEQKARLEARHRASGGGTVVPVQGGIIEAMAPPGDVANKQAVIRSLKEQIAAKKRVSDDNDEL